MELRGGRKRRVIDNKGMFTLRHHKDARERERENEMRMREIRGERVFPGRLSLARADVVYLYEQFYGKSDTSRPKNGNIWFFDSTLTGPSFFRILEHTKWKYQGCLVKTPCQQKVTGQLLKKKWCVFFAFSEKWRLFGFLIGAVHAMFI